MAATRVFMALRVKFVYAKKIGHDGDFDDITQVLLLTVYR